MDDFMGYVGMAGCFTVILILVLTACSIQDSAKSQAQIAASLVQAVKQMPPCPK